MLFSTLRRSSWGLLTAALVASSAAFGQARNPNLPLPTFTREAREPRTDLSIGLSSTFGITTSFSNLGNIPVQVITATTDLGGDGSAVTREYGDGYIRLDAQNNQTGLTSNWGFTRDNQAVYDTDPSNGINNQLRLSYYGAQVTGGAIEGLESDGNLGWEVRMGRTLGKLGKNVRWGVVGALGFGSTATGENRTSTGDLLVVTDTYNLGSVFPPAGYQGDGSGGPLIRTTPSVEGDLANPTVRAGEANVSGRYELDAAQYSVRVGPQIQVPLSRWFAMDLGAGVAAGFVASRFTTNETVSIITGTDANGQPVLDADPVVSEFSRGTNQSDVGGVFGGYVDARARFSFNSYISIYTGVSYLGVSNFDQKLDETPTSPSADLKLDSTYNVSTGFNFKF